MELLCPNCQQHVTVPDQLAGQVMKCPQCNNTFTTPSLAPATASAFVPPPAPAVPPTAETVAPGSSGSAPAVAASDATAPSAVSAPGDYRHRLGVSLSPRVLPWIAVAALVIVFVLSFFSWVGYYPGGYVVVTQNAWQAAFGSSSYGANGLLIVFVLMLVIALLAAVLAAIEENSSVRLPAILERLRPRRWIQVSTLTFLAFLFLVVQLLSGMSLIKGIREDLEQAKATAGNPVQIAQISIKGRLEELMKALDRTANSADIETALYMSAAQYTWFLWASVWLTLLAAICAALTHFLRERPTRPLPRLEFMW